MRVDPEEWKDLYSLSPLSYTCYSADLQIHILLSLYDITLSQTILRLLSLLLYHLLSLATLPSHTVVVFFIIQPIKI